MKIAIIYAKGDQKTPKEMFSNVNGSPLFEEFLQLMGEKVDISQESYRGDMSAGETYVTTWNTFKGISLTCLRF
jgi:hypothetical protein